MITARDVVLRHVREWRNLRAWGRSLDNVEIEFSSRKTTRRAGTCWTTEQRVVIYTAHAIPDMLATGLHELAHAVEMLDHHGPAWQARFAAAVIEVTGCGMPRAADDFAVLDRAAEDLVRDWWDRSGNGFAARLATMGCA